eukprot:Blabericola_migrator_1__12970@NODE_860_length_6237_cov_124_199352_g610_i0_p3_GENE_NODE_860_length_6237_cov_124_199352_g610_i0NODE_860_length_6237_cov_124_199352_g610_i0_p3_ORF_typecomplete_len298_score25_30FANCI_HD1/PF14679_6/0_0045FANCI_HD1/PF14679_6/7e03USP8_interact/PF08941_10/0_026_NODE_860_length_6237_cov_124_199352_g610_i027453638
MDDVALMVLPYLTASARLKLAQAGSSRLRRLILSEKWEREAFVEYAKFSEVYNLLNTWNRKPFLLSLPLSIANGKRLRQRVLEVMRDQIKTWHLACARAHMVPKTERLSNSCYSTCYGSRLSSMSFEELAANPNFFLMTENEAWDHISGCVSWGASPYLILLLKSSMISPEELAHIPPVDLICWSQGLELSASRELPPRSQLLSFMTPSLREMHVNDFFSWRNAMEPAVHRTSSRTWSTPQSWLQSLVRDSLRSEAPELGFKAVIASLDPDLKVVLYTHSGNEITLYGNGQCCVIRI